MFKKIPNNKKKNKRVCDWYIKDFYRKEESNIHKIRYKII